MVFHQWKVCWNRPETIRLGYITGIDDTNKGVAELGSGMNGATVQVLAGSCAKLCEGGLQRTLFHIIHKVTFNHSFYEKRMRETRSNGQVSTIKLNATLCDSEMGTWCRVW
jgi:hypothetical protein